MATSRKSIRKSALRQPSSEGVDVIYSPQDREYRGYSNGHLIAVEKFYDDAYLQAHADYTAQLEADSYISADMLAEMAELAREIQADTGLDWGECEDMAGDILPMLKGDYARGWDTGVACEIVELAAYEVGWDGDVAYQMAKGACAVCGKVASLDGSGMCKTCRGKGSWEPMDADVYAMVA